jgi:hypothetical protein
MTDAVPHIDCPKCGESLFPATNRGRHDDDGNYIPHRIECRCRWCDWIWFDDVAPVRCECGAVVGIDCDDNEAHAKLIRAFDDKACPERSGNG